MAKYKAESYGTKCNYCGAKQEPEDGYVWFYECHECCREGCPECMPAGEGCICPECEENEEG